MKQLITLLTLATAVSIHAASIDWTITGKGTATGYTGSAIASTVYFILADNVSSLTGHETEAEFLSALSGLTLNQAYSTSDGKAPDVDGVTVTNDSITGSSRQTFGMVVYSKDADGNGYYKISTGTGTGYATGATADAHTFVETSWTTMRNSDWVSAWTLQQEPVIPDDPTPGVPEPATGALALAGVALLFKRRRA